MLDSGLIGRCKRKSDCIDNELEKVQRSYYVQ